jgi:hypothetical protein
MEYWAPFISGLRSALQNLCDGCGVTWACNRTTTLCLSPSRISKTCGLVCGDTRGEGQLSAFLLHINIAILPATMGWTLLRLRNQGQDAEVVLRQTEALFESGLRQ